MKKVVFILGPTAVGKSDVAVRLAKQLNGEIISADSVQIYKGLDIGSAKITKDEMQGVEHYGIEILNADEQFSVYDFVNYTKQKIDEIIQKGKLPIVVGGTALYMKSLVLGYDFGGVEKDELLRQKLETLAQQKGNDYLFSLLKEKDAELANKTDKNNTVRLVRALEIALKHGKKGKTQVDIDAKIFALTLEREKLYQRINQRVDIMLNSGLVKEVENLLKQGLKNSQSMRAIGYKEVVGYLEGEYSYEQMVEILKQHSRNYAKRQLTFLRSFENVEYVDMTDKERGFSKVLQDTKAWLK